MTPAAAAAEAKVSRVLPAPLAERLAALRQSLGFTMRAAAGHEAPGSDILLVLGSATRSHQRVTITYRTRADEVGDRDLDPYGLVFHSGRWYAVGHDHRSGEIRSFGRTGSTRSRRPPGDSGHRRASMRSST